jgi:hypothetical protein
MRGPVRVLNVTPQPYRNVGAEQVARELATSLAAAADLIASFAERTGVTTRPRRCFSPAR